jgi:hypothetical protein
MLFKVTRAGRVVRTVQPVDGDSRFTAHADRNTHPAHVGQEVADLMAATLGLLAGRKVNAWLSKYLPSQTTVDTGRGAGRIGSGNGRGEPVVDLNGVSLKVRRLMVKGGKRSSKLTTLREASARGLFADLAALHASGRDVPVVTFLLPQDDTGHYIVAEERVLFHVSYPYREFAATGFAASVARARGTVGRAPKGTVLPDTWLSHDANTDCTGGSWLWYGAHPRTHAPSEWSVGTLDEVRALVAGLMYE